MKSIVLVCIGVIGLTLALGIYAALTATHGAPSTAPATNSLSVQDEMSYAYTDCSEEVTNRLKAPSTATFADYLERPKQTQTVDAHTYAINSYVDAENSYGAKIRTQWSCKIQILDNGNSYRLLDLSVQ